MGLIDTTGTVTDSYSYDPYGNRSTVTGSTSDTPFGYAGQYTDAETGFQYLRARYYDPATGQFLTVDPLVDVTGQPYAYAADNPINFSDSWGLCKHSVGFVCLDIVTSTASNIFGANGPVYGAYQTLSSAASGTFALIHMAGVLNGCLDPVVAAACNPQALDQQNLQMGILAAYVIYHPGDALSQAWTAIILPYQQDFSCGRAGRATGRAVTSLLLIFGPGKLDYGVRVPVSALNQDLVNFASQSRTIHILYSDAKGGGHLWPGAPGKTPFPRGWSPEQIMHAISDIATDPNLT